MNNPKFNFSDDLAALDIAKNNKPADKTAMTRDIYSGVSIDVSVLHAANLVLTLQDIVLSERKWWFRQDIVPGGEDAPMDVKSQFQR